MTTSFSETHTTEELLPARSEEEKDDEEEEERAFQNRPYPPHIGKYIHMRIYNMWNVNANLGLLIIPFPLFFFEELQPNKKGELRFYCFSKTEDS